jgi:hypothetical protein
MSDRLLTDDELADRIGKSRWFVQSQCKAGRWPHQRIGKSYRFTPAQVDAIDALLEVKVKPATTEAPENSWGRKGRTA